MPAAGESHKAGVLEDRKVKERVSVNREVETGNNEGWK